MPSIHVVRNPKHVILQWVGIKTHTHIHARMTGFLYRHVFVNLFFWCIGNLTGTNVSKIGKCGKNSLRRPKHSPIEAVAPY